MNAAEASGRDARAWAAAFADGRTRPADLLQRCLRRILRYDSELAICNHVGDREALLEQAAASRVRWWGGAPRNPPDPARIPGGSSGGSAAEGRPIKNFCAAGELPDLLRSKKLAAPEPDSYHWTPLPNSGRSAPAVFGLRLQYIPSWRELS